MERRNIVLGLILVFCIVFGVGYKLAQVREKQHANSITHISVPVEKERERTVTIYITGAVKKPGVYTFKEGSRIKDAVDRAGLTPDAGLSSINLAEIMVDQQHIVVMKINDNDDSTNGGTTGNSDGRININTAELNDLTQLPGVGPSTAQKIIDYRKQHGRFKRVEDLKKVSGIGDKKFNDLKIHVKI